MTRVMIVKNHNIISQYCVTLFKNVFCVENKNILSGKKF